MDKYKGPDFTLTVLSDFTAHFPNGRALPSTLDTKEKKRPDRLFVLPDLQTPAF